MRGIIYLIVLLLAEFAVAGGRIDDSRDLSANLGLGLGAEFASIENDGKRSNFSGWVPTVEVGLDLPWSRRSGLALLGGLRQFDLTNTNDKDNFLERAGGYSSYFKVGFFVGGIGFGGGLSDDAISLRQVSTTSGVIDTKIKGNTQLYYLSSSFNVEPRYRLTFEVQHQSGQLHGYKFVGLSASMKFIFLLDL